VWHRLASIYGETLRSDTPDFWLPLATEPLPKGHNRRPNRANLEWLYLAGRLKPGAELQQVQARLTIALQGWLHSHPGVIPDRDWKDNPR
jgi:macrolide transport system ATP-binding/permease protein